jgi:CRP-like cAMP-binding protein
MLRRREARKRAASGGTEVEVTTGRRLAAQGEPVLQVVVIVEGRAAVVVDGLPVAVLGEGATVGWPEARMGLPAPATVVTITPTVVSVFSRRELQHLTRGDRP